jgi:hypothetical protein
MLKRLGGAYYWAGCMGAVLTALVGVAVMDDAHYRDFGVFLFFAIVAGAFWLVGRSFRYIACVLSGASPRSVDYHPFAE